MQPVEVDIVTLQTAQRAMQGSIDVFAAISASIGIASFRIEGEFRGQNHTIAKCPLGNKLSHQFFAFASGVSVGRIDEIAALLDVAIEQTSGDTLLGSPPPLGAKGHGAEREGTNT
jgi:hypothetical protein